MLSFHHCSPMPIVQNEPNLEGPAGAASLPCETKPIGRSESGKTNPISGGAGWGERRGVNAQNEPNLGPAVRGWACTGRPGTSARVDCAKQTNSSISDCGLGTALRRDGRLTACHLRPAQANCAKQSQFPATPGGTGPGGRGPWDKCANRTQFPATARGPRLGERGPWSVVQTNPISGAGPGTPPSTLRPRPPAKPIVRNKPNSDRGHVRDKSCMGKDLWCIIHAEDFGKTKPIAGVAGRSFPGARPSGLWPPSVGCTNKPNWPPADRQAGPWLEAIVRNKPNLSIAQNEPNSRQGRVGGGPRGVGPGPNVQNEPNLHLWGRIGGATPPTVQADSIASNKPNSVQPGLHRRRNVRNEPNLGRVSSLRFQVLSWRSGRNR